MDGTRLTTCSRCHWWPLAVMALGVVACPVGADEAWARERAAMVREIEESARETGGETGRSRFDPAVMAAIGRVPRHRFVPEAERDSAYENRPLAIGYGQTISQPYIVALMTDLLRPSRDHHVLEIGTGSGYQAAVLAELVAEVSSIEIVEPLAAQARTRLRDLGYGGRIQTRVGDGYYGWPERAPFDSIIVTAAAGSVPPPLLAQLKPGGRLVIPVGGPFFTQTLIVVEKDAQGGLRTRRILPVRFVPLTGGH